MSNKITVEFTYAELDAYHYAARNTWDHCDVVQTLFDGYSNHRTNAGYRAEEKIQEALRNYRNRRPSEFNK